MTSQMQYDDHLDDWSTETVRMSHEGTLSSLACLWTTSVCLVYQDEDTLARYVCPAEYCDELKFEVILIKDILLCLNSKRKTKCLKLP